MTKSAQNKMLLQLNDASLLREKCEDQENKTKRLMNIMATILILSIVIFIGSHLFIDSSLTENYNLNMLNELAMVSPYVALVIGINSLVWLIKYFFKMISLEPETYKARKFEASLIERVYKVLAINSNGDYNFKLVE